jgi:glutathione synthase/RimK-type ligase-like ATP-grasp enzyme
MILAWGIMSDDTMLSVYNWLKILHADIYFLNHSAIEGSRMKFSSTTHSYQLYDCGQTVPLENITAAYLRPYDFRQYEPIVENSNQARKFTIRANQFHFLINAWAESSNAKLINKPSAEASNHSKLFQSRIIHTCGFPVPESLVSNDWETIRLFASGFKGLIYKSMSSIRSIVKEISLSELHSRADKIGPGFFQEKISGKNIRVHVIGGQVFSCLIESNEIDYRYAPHMISTIEIPSDIQSKCLLLTQKLGLLIAGIDLMVTADLKWYCLEVNPNPGFSFYDVSDEKNIARAVAELLTNS